MDTMKEFLESVLITVGDYKIRVLAIVSLIIIFFATKLILWIIKKALFRGQDQVKIDTGNSYALYQIIRYVIWIIAIGVILETAGIKVTLLVAGSAALLVGVGLGLQQTFNDIVSGIILLVERSTKVGDILEIDGDVVMIQNIGLRTSSGLNRDDISIIIPNSLITSNKVINWSHQSKETRFRIDVGVAYGSDVDLVVKILTDAAIEHPDVSVRELIDVRFVDFGNSSLDFQLLFFSENIFRIERVKSDIRKAINRKFKESGVTIPFPQIDVHMKSSVKPS